MNGHIECGKLNILGNTYQIHLVENVRKYSLEVGLFVATRNAILLDRSLPYDRMCFTLIHEVLHAIFWEIGEEDLWQNEPFICRISTGVYYFIKYNNLLELFKNINNSDKLPSLNILGLVFCVKASKNQRTKINDEIDYAEITIKQRKSSELTILGLLNKVIYIILFMLGHPEEAKDEDLKKRTATALYQVFKDNNLLAPGAIKNLFYTEETKFLFPSGWDIE
jgi:hypothetical protein